MKEKILEIAVQHWNENFGGISALHIAQTWTISHQEVVQYFHILRNEGKGTIRENVKLYPISFRRGKKGNIVTEEEGEVVTAVFFPSKEILKKQFEIENRDYSPFLNRLHQGNSRIEHYYFMHEVLHKYFNHLERYYIQDDVIGGHILTKDEYYLSLPENTRKENTFAQIRYGKRKLADDSVVIAVILYDLSELPLKEQKYWESYEIDHPDFSTIDNDFEKYTRQNFEAEFIDYEDPLSNIVEKIESINRLFDNEKLFRHVENLYLRYPTINTEKAYNDAHNELYKLIGTDSINKELIKDILLKNLGKTDDDLIHTESQREKGIKALFETIFENLETPKPTLIKTAWSTVQTGRVCSAHKITQPTLPRKYFIKQFRDDCTNLLKALTIVEKELIKIMAR